MNKYLPYALVVMAVVFSIFGMADAGMHPLKIAALATLHGIFVKLLSGTLQSMIDEAKANVPKAFTLGFLGLSFGIFDVWLVHYGLGLMLEGWTELAVYGASVAFAAVNVFAHWAYTPTQPKADDIENAGIIGATVTRLRGKVA